MPFYEYECLKCGEKFEALISMTNRESEEAELSCPACDASGAKRLISQFATGKNSTPDSTPPCFDNCPHGG